MRYKVEFEISNYTEVQEHEFLEWLKFELGVHYSMRADNPMEFACLQSHGVAELEIRPVCKQCNGPMKPGVAIEETLTGVPDFAGGSVVTMSPGGPGKLIDVLKCELCGWSVTD